MIHFLTVHFRSDEWIDIQLRQIKRHTSAEYRTWASLNGIGQHHHSKFDRVFDLDGTHPEKLNVLAEHVIAEAEPDDLLVFIDGDAFPIDEWTTPITRFLPAYPLVAVRRTENLGDPQPHPCFAVTTVRFWQQIGGDWSRGNSWINEAGMTRTDTGGRIMARLEELGVPWYPLLRSNKKDLHPVLFAVYSDLVYHHGAGFRTARTSVDGWKAGSPRRRRGFLRVVAQRRLKRRVADNLRLSERVYEEILRDDDYVKKFFLRRGDDKQSETGAARG